MLTNAAPQLADIVAENGTIDAIVQDDQTYGDIEATVDFDADGIIDLSFDTAEGEFVSIDVTNYIPANQTGPVTVVLTETYANEENGTTDIVSSSVTINASGLVIAAMNFEWLEAAESIASGTVQDAQDAVADVDVMWREVGDTEWTGGNGVDSDGLFDIFLADADGEKDFEFVVSHGGILGDTVIINDVTAFSDGGGSESGNGAGGPGSGWGTGEGEDDDDDDFNGLFGW